MSGFNIKLAPTRTARQPPPRRDRKGVALGAQMAPHQDALSALGNIYDGSSDDDESDDEPAAAAASAPAASAPTAAAAAAPVKEALPDAGDLLSDMPDEVDWSARPGPVEEEAPGHDPVGTTYNNVPLPTTMAREQDAHNDVAHSKAGKGKGKPAYKPLRQAPASSKADGALGVSCVLAGLWAARLKRGRRRLLRPAQPRAGCATERTHFGPPGSGKNLLPPQVRREARHMPHPACPARRLLRPALEAGPQREDRPPSACFLRSPQTLAVRALSRGLSAAAA